jgi:hypothetical protein
MRSASELTATTRDVLARRAEAVSRMFAGTATYADVLAFHAEDFVWLSPSGVTVGHQAAAEYQARRLAFLPPQALAGYQVLSHQVSGEYGFTMFRTGEMPFGVDTYRVVDGKVAFQSNALYLPRRYRPAGRGGELAADE